MLEIKPRSSGELFQCAATIPVLCHLSYLGNPLAEHAFLSSGHVILPLFCYQEADTPRKITELSLRDYHGYCMCEK